MFTSTKIALAAALILGSASAALTNDAGKVSGQARASYAQAQVRPSLNGDPSLSTVQPGAVRPFTQFEKTWFHYQDQE